MSTARLAPRKRVSALSVPRDDLNEAGNVYIPTPAQYAKIFLTPEQAVAGKLRITFANPTPVALAGFLLANTPATIDLMGWGGAGGGVGNTSAGIGAYFYLGALLLYLGGIGEWILGNTFPCVIFFTYGGFWATYGATLMPFYHASSNYETQAGFENSIAMFLIFIAVISLLFCVASIRTNICFFSILFSYALGASFLASSFMYAARERDHLSGVMRTAAGAWAFIASIVCWYLWFSLILESVNFPYALPVGDLSTYIKGKCDIVKEADEAAHLAEKEERMA